MTVACASPIADARLIDYWTGDLSATDAIVLEEHLFSCGHCSARLDGVASVAGGVARLARQGRLSGIISRALLNRLQRDGVRVRQYTLSPGETVPCAAFPGDDVVVTSLNANLTGVSAVSLRVTGSGGALVGAIDDIPVSATASGVLWTTPGAMVRSMPSQQLRLTLRKADGAGDILGEYMLDHTMNLEAEKAE